jgi:hypothetical protein
MFEVGDLVKFKGEGVASMTRIKPHKKIGLVVHIERDVYQSYNGDTDDAITVSWLGTDEEEIMPEFYLEKVDEDT